MRDFSNKSPSEEEEEEFIFRTKPNIKMNKHVNKVRKATDRAEAITAGRQQNKQQYLIIDNFIHRKQMIEHNTIKLN